MARMIGTGDGGGESAIVSLTSGVDANGVVVVAACTFAGAPGGNTGKILSVGGSVGGWTTGNLLGNIGATRWGWLDGGLTSSIQVSAAIRAVAPGTLNAGDVLDVGFDPASANDDYAIAVVFLPECQNSPVENSESLQVEYADGDGSDDGSISWERDLGGLRGPLGASARMITIAGCLPGTTGWTPTNLLAVVAGAHVSQDCAVAVSLSQVLADGELAEPGGAFSADHAVGNYQLVVPTGVTPPPPPPPPPGGGIHICSRYIG